MNIYKHSFGDTKEYPKTKEMLAQMIKIQWEKFHTAHGRFPTSQEIDNSDDMVTSRTIQRKFGSLKELRKLLGHETLNYSAGPNRSQDASNAMQRSLNDEYDLTAWLTAKFGERPYVMPGEVYKSDARVFSDCGVYHLTGHIFVDIFCAKDKYSMAACVSHKHRKLKKVVVTDPVYFVSSNTGITQDEIDQMINNKKDKLPSNVIVVTLSNFKKICEGLEPISV